MSKKQASMFSFFKQKPSGEGASSKSIFDPPSKVIQKATISSTLPQAKTNPTSTSTPNSTSSTNLNVPPVLSKIDVLWVADKKYYPATIEAILGNQSTSTKVRVRYEDGETEIIDLSTQKYRLPSANDSEEEEFEFDDDNSDGGFAPGSESSHSSDDESLDSDDDADADADADADGMLVDSDSDDEKPRKRKLTQKSKPKPKPNKKQRNSVSFSPDASSKPKPKPTAKFDNFKLTMVDVDTNTPSSAKSVSAITPEVKDSVKASYSPPKNNSSTNAANANTNANNNAPNARLKVGPNDAVNPIGAHVHDSLPFLFPENLKDANGRHTSHPDYDPRTLQWSEKDIEKVTKGKLTAGKRQWWNIKAQYFDTVLLFKTGKFYELFHMDADIGVQVNGFIYMKGSEAHSGTPEAALGKLTKDLIAAGYKVARVEQTETPAMLNERKKNAPTGKKPQVVNREVCSVSTVGTRTYCYLDDSKCFENADAGVNVGGGPLLVIRECMLAATPSPSSSSQTEDDDTPPAVCEYGVCVVDAIRGNVTLGQFADDVLRSRLHTLLCTVQPSEIITDTTCSHDLKTLVKNVCPGATLEKVRASELMPTSSAIDPKDRSAMNRPSPASPWDFDETIGQLRKRKYFPSASKGGNDSGDNFASRWPPVMKACVEGKATLAVSAFGAGLFYLQRSLVDYEILSMCNIRAYVPAASTAASCDATPSQGGNQVLNDLSNANDAMNSGVAVGTGTGTTSSSNNGTNHMQLDGITLDNLEVLQNQSDGTVKGSLWNMIKQTQTPHGTRLLRAWLLRPLFKKADIERRCDAVTELASGSASLALSTIRPILKKMNDLERLLARCHAMGNDDPSHPSNRQILYEGKKYTAQKVKDFSSLLKGLQAADQIPEAFANVELSSGLLTNLVSRREEEGENSNRRVGLFPNMHQLKWFNDNVDLKVASEGKYTPIPGTDEEYDGAIEDMANCRADLEVFKREKCQEIKGANGAWKYINDKDDARDKYLIELPASLKVPRNFLVKAKRGSGAKQINKYKCEEVDELVNRLEAAISIKVDRSAKGLDIIFRKFASHKETWAAAAYATAMIDAIGALAVVSGEPGFCRPTIMAYDETTSQPGIEVVEGRHPCVEISGGEFVPNSIDLGGTGAPRVLLLSGPNMGGKSTLLRQTCLVAILAQIGCHVPATSCSLTPFDRIFTRLGASDRILSGQSTFFVELSETAAALRGATRRSMCIMDELGRGTSTFDGCAIAHAVVKYLIENSGCLAMFATHYHSLLDDWKNEKKVVKLGHMECYVDNEDEAQQKITFLYQLAEGACPRSFGINVARLANLPEAVLKIAKNKSALFEDEMNVQSNDAACTKLNMLIKNEDAEGIKLLWSELK